ncbi:allantoinase AllB [Staphylococcus massiliensis]|uniref:Allantoinase n=1 Tax=Staphylococcus massiliensis S46 TaxID=1229783 RepID=K9AHM9_9STAP|nr:allantoinase AllB [Staphylococcus massiliensis]EKU46813.1 allantoinase [Staphylococcus massiliensis S46]MCG3399273.1 allantoinase AllB [Staphylococcus massiliensis]MCG3402343.1 allantoinase AllB [Staphylococcus massiliensis]MCG3411690.1 allantoinase AllB [Staphylococcus massiliensis]POA01707.1 allantoinase AllB [Staphylococcus massiliensis CCUG 55927]
MTNRLSIINGTVLLPNQAKVTNINVENGKIVEIGDDIAQFGRIIDAKGLIVSPGMVDAHVHISEPGGGVRDLWEGYETGTRAAAKGGVTTFIEMPLNQIPATTDHASFMTKLKSGEGKLTVDVASYGGVVPYNLNGGIQEQHEDGVVGFKCFLATCGDPSIEGDFMNVDDYSLYEGMKQVKATGKTLLVHAENAAITDKLQERYLNEGKTSMTDYVDSRPVIAEVEAIRKVILFAKETGCPVHIVHVACHEGVEAVVAARRDGVDITCETCTHYLYFAKSMLNALGPVAKSAPPIREADQREALFKDLINGDISFVTSDHSPCTPDLKDTDNAFKAWGGISGLQNDVDILFDEAVNKRGMSLVRFQEVIAKHPAAKFNLSDKGTIEVGKDADFVMIDPNQGYTLSEDDLEYRNPMSPYVGMHIGARVVRTILRGETVYDIDGGVASRKLGTFLFEKP